MHTVIFVEEFASPGKEAFHHVTTLPTNDPATLKRIARLVEAEVKAGELTFAKRVIDGVAHELRQEALYNAFKAANSGS